MKTKAQLRAFALAAIVACSVQTLPAHAVEKSSNKSNMAISFQQLKSWIKSAGSKTQSAAKMVASQSANVELCKGPDGMPIYSQKRCDELYPRLGDSWDTLEPPVGCHYEPDGSLVCEPGPGCGRSCVFVGDPGP